MTVTSPQNGGYITVFPCGQSRPGASNLNYSSGQSIPNLVIVGVGTGGRICLYTSATTQLIADLQRLLPGSLKSVLTLTSRPI